MISHKHKFIFIHVPKAGGTSIMRALRQYDLLGEGHYTLGEIILNNNLSRSHVKDYFKFAVIRNPWDIVVSNYHYSRMKKSFWHSDDGSTRYSVHPDYDAVSKIEFDQYVRLVTERKLNHRFAMTPQSYWIDDHVDYLIRFEDLDAGFANACQQIGLGSVSLEKVNASKHDHYSVYYDAVSVKLIEDYFRQDVERFNYSFERAGS